MSPLVGTPLRPTSQRTGSVNLTDKQGLGESWRIYAACLGINSDIFFPEPYELPAPAKAICRVCPVTAECLTYALAGPEHYGIWGGLTERERREPRRRKSA